MGKIFRQYIGCVERLFKGREVKKEMLAYLKISITGVFWGIAVGLATGVVASLISPHLTTKEEDRSLKGILYLWKRSVPQAIGLIVVLGPLVEEIFFRLLGISLLSYVFTGIVPLILTSILFGLAHNQYPINVISGFLGFILALVFKHFGLLASVLAHATHNAVSLLYLSVITQQFLGISLTEALNKMEVEEVMQRLEQQSG